MRETKAEDEKNRKKPTTTIFFLFCFCFDDFSFYASKFDIITENTMPFNVYTLSLFICSHSFPLSLRNVCVHFKEALFFALWFSSSTTHMMR